MRNLSQSFSRRAFLAHTARLGAFYTAAKLMPLETLGGSLATASRVAETPLVDRGFASVRQIGKGLYATISDRSKGLQTRSNGGFLVGRDRALLIEGFQTPTGAAFQMEALRMVTQVRIQAAIDSHFHFDHSLGNSLYGGNGVPVWAHAKAAARMMEKYPPMQSEDLDTLLAPWNKRVNWDIWIVPSSRRPE